MNTRYLKHVETFSRWINAQNTYRYDADIDEAFDRYLGIR